MKKKLLVTLLAVVMVFATSVSMIVFTGCGAGLSNGIYSLTSLRINGVEQSQTSDEWWAINLMNFTVSGNSITISGAGINQTVNFRVRGGYLEQQFLGRWIREDGSSAAGFNSLRVENGNIVMRAGVMSQLGQIMNGEIQAIFAIGGGGPDLPTETPDINLPNSMTPTSEQILGRWYLQQIYTSGMLDYPGSNSWIGGYFIEFNEFTFREMDFWNYPIETGGAWVLSGDRLNLTRVHGNTLYWNFVASRRVAISTDLQTLTIAYSRTQLGNTWIYIHTFRRDMPDGGWFF